jgi:membrane protein DedA with SNARE-associated domain
MEAITLRDIASWFHEYGLIVVFLAPMLEIVTYIVPGETVMLFAGYLAQRGYLPLYAVLAAGFAGAVCGITLSYSLGRFLGAPLAGRYGRYVHVSQRRLDRVNAWYERHGKWSLTTSYYIPLVRHVIAIVAGMSKLSWPVFALYAYPGALLWVGGGGA